MAPAVTIQLYFGDHLKLLFCSHDCKEYEKRSKNGIFFYRRVRVVVISSDE